MLDPMDDRQSSAGADGLRIWVRAKASEAGVKGTEVNQKETDDLATVIDGGSISHHAPRRCLGIAFSSGPGEIMVILAPTSRGRR